MKANIHQRLARIEASLTGSGRTRYVFASSQADADAKTALLFDTGEAQSGDDVVVFITVYEPRPEGDRP